MTQTPWHSRSAASPTLALALAAGLILTAAGTGYALRLASVSRAAWPGEADTYYLPSSETLRLLSLGHRELAADLLHARSNVYFGSQMAVRGQQRWIAKYLHTVIDLDPHFKRPYASGAAMLIYGGRGISIEGVEAANGVLRRGLQIFPFDWELRFHLGFNLFFELPSIAGPDHPRAPDWRQEGLEALQEVALYEEVPSWLPSVVARALTRRGQDELAVRHLEQAYATASEEARPQIRSKLSQLKAARRGDELEEEGRRFIATVQERYPYAPDAFSVVAGPRQPRSVSLGALAPAQSSPAPTPDKSPPAAR